ncbi:hypothetical protein [Terrabacter sp. 2YAF2]|uniref:hypothetical protein n=1 Tax=Terrabacter sp. 2YAF2 TaxID=3233026 RepID=UPI003F943DE3
MTDDESRRRFRRYWLVIGPFSSVIRRVALRLVATELDRVARDRAAGARERGHEIQKSARRQNR